MAWWARPALSASRAWGPAGEGPLGAAGRPQGCVGAGGAGGGERSGARAAGAEQRAGFGRGGRRGPVFSVRGRGTLQNRETRAPVHAAQRTVQRSAAPRVLGSPLHVSGGCGRHSWVLWTVAAATQVSERTCLRGRPCGPAAFPFSCEPPHHPSKRPPDPASPSRKRLESGGGTCRPGPGGAGLDAPGASRWLAVRTPAAAGFRGALRVPAPTSGLGASSRIPFYRRFLRCVLALSWRPFVIRSWPVTLRDAVRTPLGPTPGSKGVWVSIGLDKDGAVRTSLACVPTLLGSNCTFGDLCC